MTVCPVPSLARDRRKKREKNYNFRKKNYNFSCQCDSDFVPGRPGTEDFVLVQGQEQKCQDKLLCPRTSRDNRMFCPGLSLDVPGLSRPIGNAIV